MRPFQRPFRLLAACVIAAVFTPIAFAAEPTDPTTAVIFAGGNITFNSFSTIAGAPVVTNGNVTVSGGILNLPSLFAGGSLTVISGAQNSTGDILTGGDINGIGGPGVTFGGNVTSGGSIMLADSSEQITGNLTAVGSVSEPFSFASIGGNLLVGGDANIQGTVGGGVTYGGNLTQGTFSQIGGLITHGGAVSPTPYNALTLPASRNLTPGTSNVALSNFQSTSLAPGAYGDLDFATGNTVTLTAGQYVFAGISNTFSLNQLAFDTSGGPINVYVAGDLDFNLVQVINGQALFAGGNPIPADSNKITFEVGGSFTADASVYGTILAPNGDITLDSFASDTGRLLAGGNVTINTGNVTYVPEPAALALFTLAAAPLLIRRKKKQRCTSE